MIFRRDTSVWNAADSELDGWGTAMTRRGRALLVAALLPLSGCGFLRDMAEPDGPPSVPVATPASSDPPHSAGPVVVAEGFLRSEAGGAVGRITVTVGVAETGFVPPVPNFSGSCPVEPTSLQYVPVSVGFTANSGARPVGAGLAARLDVGVGPSTPADIGDVGIVVESGDGTERYCHDYPPLPTSDRFWNQLNTATVTGFVVLDRAVTPATPDGRPDVFPTLGLRISELRLFSDPEDVRRLRLGELSVGAACPDDAEAICVPLG
jgi:hypothetical protein